MYPAKRKPLSLFQFFMLTLVLAFCSSQSISQHSAIMDRANRLLQTTNGSAYVITPSPDIKINCEDQGVSASSLSLTLEQRDAAQASFSGSSSPLVSALDGGTSSIDFAGLIRSAVAGPLGVAGIFFVLSFLSLVFLFFWSITECCCKKTCCVKDDPAVPGRSKARIICWIIGAVIGVATVGVTIGWVVSLGKLSGAAKDLKCAITIFYSDIVMGTNLENGSKFAGTKGISSILTSYVSFIDGVPSIKADAQTVVNFGLGAKGLSTVAKYVTFKAFFNSATYTYKGGKTSSATVLANIGTYIKGAIDSKALEGEVNTLNSTAAQIHTAVSKIAAYSTSSLSSVRSNLVSMNSTLTKSLETPLTDLYKQVAGVGSPDYSAQISSAMKTFMIVSIIVIVLFTVIYLVILYFTGKMNKFHGLKIISKIIMIIQLILGILILVFAIISAIISILFIVMCAVMNGAITTADYIAKVSSDSTIKNVMTYCVYKNGNGDLLKALGADFSEMNTISDISTGMQSYEKLTPNLTSQTSPYIGGGFATNLSNYLAFTDVDRGTPQSEDVQTGYEYFNTLRCASDVIAPKTVPAGYTESAPAHTVSQGVNTNYCFTFANIPNTVTTYGTTPRYTLACTGAGTLTTTAGGAQLQVIVDSIKDYKVKYTLLKTDYDNNFYLEEGGLFTAMLNSKPYLDRINTKISNATATLSSLNGTFSAVADCTVMRKEIILVENVLCYRIGQDFISQTALAVAVGTLIFIYTWFICCGIRLATKTEDAKPNQVAPQGYNKAADNSMPAQNGYASPQNASMMENANYAGPKVNKIA